MKVLFIGFINFSNFDRMNGTFLIGEFVEFIGII